MAMKKLKGGILNAKLKDFTFNLDFQKYKDFTIAFTKGLPLSGSTGIGTLQTNYICVKLEETCHTSHLDIQCHMR